MKKLGSLFVVLSLFGMSAVSIAEGKGSLEEMTGRDGETCSVMPSEIGKTSVKEEIAGDVFVPEVKKQLEVPVEDKTPASK